jgi:biotin carboxyl carrier protein
MSNDLTIESARARIQQLVEEIAALSKAEMPSEEFFQKYTEKVVAATDAFGGAVWLVGAGAKEKPGEFQLCGHVNFQSSLFQSDNNQRAILIKLLNDVVASKQPRILAPEPSSTLENPGPSYNKTPYAFLHVPIFLQQQALGVVQVWLKPYVTAKNYGEFVVFLSSLTGHVEHHLQAKRTGNLVVENQRLQHLLRFSSDLSGCLDATEVARLAANYGRDLVGCERSSVLLFDREKWKVLAISGQEVVESKSSMVKSVAAFVAAHCAPGGEIQVLSKKELLAKAGVLQTESSPEGAAPESQSQLAEAERSLAPGSADQIDLAYFELSHVQSAVVCPMLDADKQLVGACFFETTAEGYFDSPAPKGEGAQPAVSGSAIVRVADWIAKNSSRALVAARDYQTLPFLGSAKRVRAGKLLLTGKKRNRFLAKTAVIGGIAAVIALWPAQWKVDGNCVLGSLNRGVVVPEVAGRIESVFVKEGDRVKKGAPIAQIDTRRLQLELQGTIQDKLRYLAEADRVRALGDEASAQVSLLQSKALEESEKRIRSDIESATLRSPIDGIVMTKDLEVRAGEVVQAGTSFAEVDGSEAWQLQVDVNERDISLLEEALAKNGSLDANFILYSQSAHIVRTKLSDHKQISAMAYPREKENVFLVTIDNPGIPPEMEKNLRPGLTGRAKIELGHRPLIFNLLRRIYRWAQFKWIG